MIRFTEACRDLEVDLHRLRIALEDDGTEQMRRDAERFVREMQDKIRAYCASTGLPALQERRP